MVNEHLVDGRGGIGSAVSDTATDEVEGNPYPVVDMGIVALRLEPLSSSISAGV